MLDDAAEDGPPQDLLVHGLAIPADSHSILVCDGGGLKSFLLLLVLGEMAKAGIPVGYLDWEWNAPRHKGRKVRIFGHERLEHLHCLRNAWSAVMLRASRKLWREHWKSARTFSVGCGPDA